MSIVTTPIVVAGTGPLGEEFGWRVFALPRLLRRLTICCTLWFCIFILYRRNRSTRGCHLAPRTEVVREGGGDVRQDGLVSTHQAGPQEPGRAVRRLLRACRGTDRIPSASSRF